MSAFNWYDPNWTKAKKFRYRKSHLSGSDALADFRYLISFTDAAVAAAARADGRDILFTEDDGLTRMEHDLVSYVTGMIIAIAKKTTQDPAEDLWGWMFYGYAAAPAQEDEAACWAGTISGIGVWHFQGDVLDSSGNSNDGTNVGTTSGTGMVGLCRVFNGSSQYITVPGAGFQTLEEQQAFAVVANIKSSSTGTRQIITVKGNTGKETISMYLDPTGHVVFAYYLAGTYHYMATGATIITDGNWHRVWGVIKGEDIYVYVDGADDTDSATGGTSRHTTTEDLYIGSRLNADYFFNGSIDDVIVYNGAPTADYIASDWPIYDDPSLLSRGPERDAVTAVEAEREVPVDSLEGIEADREVPTDELEDVRADRTVPVDALEGIVEDVEIPIMAGVDFTIFEIPTDALEGVQADEDILVDELEGIHADRTIPVDAVETIHADEEILLDALEGIHADREIPIFAVTEVQAGSIVPVDALAEIEADVTVPLHVLLPVTEDFSIPSDALEEIRVDATLNVAAQKPIAADRTMPADLLEGILADNEIPTDALEAIASGFAIPIDVLLPVAQNWTVPTDAMKAVAMEAEIPIEILLPIAQELEIPVDMLRAIIKDGTIPIALLSPISKDVTAPVDVLRGMATDLILPADALRAIARDVTIPIWSGAGAAIIPIAADFTLPMDAMIRIAADLEIPLASLKAISKDSEIPLAMILPIASDHTIPVDMLSGAPIILGKTIRALLIGEGIFATLWQNSDD